MAADDEGSEQRKGPDEGASGEATGESAPESAEAEPDEA